MTNANYIHYATNYGDGIHYHLVLWVDVASTTMAVLNTTTKVYECIINYLSPITQISNEQLRTNLKLAQVQLISASAQLYNANMALIPNNTIAANELDYTHTDALTLINAQIAYNVSPEIIAKLQQLSPAITLHHHTAISIQNVLTNLVKQPNESLVTATLYNKLLHVCVVKNGVFTLSNYYDIKHTNDVVYYLLFTYNQLQLSNTAVPLYVYADAGMAKLIATHLMEFIQTTHITHNLPTPYTLHSSIDSALTSELYPLLTLHPCV
ncbi:MAG: DUF3822 family protein [Bacteroidia bacterium]|nr:DUF3822 family protein [Bacteroidia bacterium]